MPATTTSTSELLLLLEEAFKRRAWHGTNLLGSIRGIEPEAAAWRPGPGRHNIWELIIHTAYWKHAVTRRLTGAKRGTFPYPGSNWFQRDGGTPEDLRHDIELLKQCHRDLMEAVRKVKPAQLNQHPPGSKQLRGFMIRGVASHDLYHAGQVQLLKRLRTAIND
jgi:DinB superfamily